MGHETGQDCVTDCKAFSTLQNNTGILFSLEEGCFYLETEWFLPIIGDKEEVIGIYGFRYRQEFEQFCLLLLRCQEPEEMSVLDKYFSGYGYAWNWLSHYDDYATKSLKTMKTVTACEQALHLRDTKRSHVQMAWKGDAGTRCGERKWELVVSSLLQSFATHSRVYLPLKMESLLPVHNISL